MSDLAAKLKSAYEASEFCDVDLILCSGTVLKCHSVVLQIHGDYFKGRLNPTWVREEVPTVDCSMFMEEVVLNMVQFMYGTKFPLSMETIEETIRCCDYFGVGELELRSVEYLIGSICCENVFSVLIIGDKYSLTPVKAKCFEFIDCNAENLLSNYEGFFTTPLNLVVEMISRDTLSVHEELLFDNLIMWLDQQDGDPVMVWQQLCKHVCFLSMSVEYFVTQCISQNVVDSDSNNKILLYLSSVDKVDFRGTVIKHKRCVVSKSDVFVKRFFRTGIDSTWETDDMNGDRIIICVSRDIKLKAISLYGKTGDSFLCSVSVHETDNGSLVQRSKCRLDFDSDCHLLPFKTSISLKKDKRYTIVAMKEGGNTCYGVHGLASSKVYLKDGSPLEVTFYDSHVGNSTVNNGQFEGLLFVSLV